MKPDLRNIILVILAVMLIGVAGGCKEEDSTAVSDFVAKLDAAGSADAATEADGTRAAEPAAETDAGTGFDPAPAVDADGHNGTDADAAPAADSAVDTDNNADSQADSDTGSGRMDDWGFQPFDVPGNVVSVQVGGDLQGAVNQLAGGGTLRLAAGTFQVTHLDLPSNTVLEGAGPGQTVIQSAGGGYVISIRHDTQNVIIRNLTVDATGNGEANGLEIVYGPDNVLVENIEIFGAGKSNLIVWNPDHSQASENITFKDITSYDADLYHCISFRIVDGGQILDSETFGCGGYGVDISTSTYIEMAGNDVHDSMGTKYPAVDYVYIHDNIISDNFVDDGPGMKIQREGGPAGHLHIQDNQITNNRVSVRDWTTSGGDPHFAELVFKNNTISGPDGGAVYLGTVERLEVYGANGTLTPNHPADADPADDGVGVDTW